MATSISPRLTEEPQETSECWTLTAEYSAQWRGDGETPDVFQFLRSRLSASPEERARVFLLDQARTWTNGQGRTVEEYIRHCPEIAADRALLVKLIAHEYYLQDHPDSHPSISSLVSRFPHLRTELLELLYSGDNERTSASIEEPLSEHSMSEETAASGIDGVSESIMTLCDADSPAAQVWLVDRSEQLGLNATQSRDGSSDPDPTLDSLELKSSTTQLRNCFPFDSLDPVLVDKLESHMVEQTYAEGETIIRQGDPGTSLLLVKSGTIAISVCDDKGIRHEIDISGPGEVLGEMALLTEEPRSATLIACEKVKVAVLPAATFHEYASKSPELSHVLAKLLAKRLGHESRDALTGKTLDRYRISRRLGKGGMSVVYDGLDQERDRRVALKMLSHRLVYDPASLAWFQREADLIESFEHPNIVRMLGRFRAFHTYFIVMEFCDGITLEKLLRLNGPLPEPEFRKAFGQLASALQYAHDRDVIHRDIKPVNLMLNFDGRLKLMDFGLAMPLSEPTLDAEEDTTHIVGTPRYMAPEQLKGSTLSKATDLFSLGCTAYRLLTGDSLFNETDVLKLREAHKRWKVPNFAAQRPDFSPDICELLTGLLQRRAKNRSCDLTQYATWAAPLDVANLL